MSNKPALISVEQIETLYQPLFTIGALGATPDSGYFRPSWSKEEQAAFAYIKAEAEKIGLVARYDEVGNLFLEQTGFDEYVECGSHLDTVMSGGNYDGVAGIVTGLAAIRTIIESRCALKRGLRLRIWRGEESATHFTGCKGSRAAFGKLSKETLSRKFGEETLAQSITALGYNPEPVEAGRPTISAEEINGIHAHIELHIEQANFLEQEQIDIGVVTSIRGPARWKVILHGKFDHSGGTPMGTKFRKDANLAMAAIMLALDALCQEALNNGEDLVQTFGVINSDRQLSAQHPEVFDNAIAKVSGFGYFTLDIRSCQRASRADYIKRALSEVHRVAELYRVTASIEKLSETDPCESLDQAIQVAELAAAQQLGYSVASLPSGAVHDCLYVAEQTRKDGSYVPVGMLFIPCREGISHAPEEFSTMEAVAKGANVLALALAELGSK